MRVSKIMTDFYFSYNFKPTALMAGLKGRGTMQQITVHVTHASRCW